MILLCASILFFFSLIRFLYNSDFEAESDARKFFVDFQSKTWVTKKSS